MHYPSWAKAYDCTALEEDLAVILNSRLQDGHYALGVTSWVSCSLLHNQYTRSVGYATAATCPAENFLMSIYMTTIVMLFHMNTLMSYLNRGSILRDSIKVNEAISLFCYIPKGSIQQGRQPGGLHLAVAVVHEVPEKHC